MTRTRMIGALAMTMLMAIATPNVFAQDAASVPSETANVGSAAKQTKTETKAANRTLQKDVVRALSKTKGLRSSAITVRADNGMVILEGTVPETSQIELAQHVAEGVAGVKAVKNALTLSAL